MKEVISNAEARICTAYFQPRAHSLFQTEWKRIFHLSKLIELEGTPCLVKAFDNKPLIITFGTPKQSTYYPYGFENEEFAIDVTESQPVYFNDVVGKDFSIARTLLSKSIKSLIREPLRSEGWSVYDCSTDLTSQINNGLKSDYHSKNLAVHEGFSYQFRVFDNELYMQILPSSRIAYKKSFSELISDNFTRENIAELFPYATIMGQGSRKFIKFLPEVALNPIAEEPFFGRNFIEYSKAMFKENQIERQDRQLIKVGWEYTGEIEIYPTCWAFPSITITGLSSLNESYFGALLGILRTHSRKRMVDAQQWAKRFSKIPLFSQDIEVNQIPLKLYYNQPKLDVAYLSRVNSFSDGYVFERPAITLRLNGLPHEIFPRVGKYSATINDLKKFEELKPLDVPKEINLIVFVHSPLLKQWTKLKNALTIPNRSFRSVSAVFGVTLNFEEVVIDDFFGQQFDNEIENIPDQGYHCALVIIPRMLNSSKLTRRIYSETKTKIMSRGVPVQIITNDRITGKDKSLEGKANDADTLFGIAINIIAKVGGVITALAESTANKLIPNSMTMGYDISRVIPRDTTNIKTIPLSAPLVIFDNRGAYISHQNVYKLNDEISLFEQFGEGLFEEIPDTISTLIIHKNNFFTTRELLSLEKCAKRRGIEVIPISIKTGSVPRISNPNYLSSQLGFDSGTVLPLSANDFLMATTPFGNWNPERLGWPNPILITLHGKYDVETRLRLLYQIFALTKLQTGSQRALRLPVSIHFADMVSKFLRLVGNPNPTYLNYFVQTNPDKCLPRWFL